MADNQLNELPTKPPPKHGLMNSILIAVVAVTLLVAIGFALWKQFSEGKNPVRETHDALTTSTNR